MFFILLSYCCCVERGLSPFLLISAEYFYIIWFFGHFAHLFYSIGFYCQIASIVTHFINAQVVMKIHIQAHNHTIQKAYRSNIRNFTFHCIIEIVPI